MSMKRASASNECSSLRLRSWSGFARVWRAPVWIVEQVVIDLLRPLAHTDGPVGRTYNIAAEYIVAVVEPHVCMQRVVHQYIVLADSVKALAQLQAAIQ